MRRKIVLLLIVLGLGVSMIACTTGRSQRYPYPRYPGPGYPNYPQYPNYPGYPGGYGNQMEQVRSLANHLKDATAEVIEEATEADTQDDYQETAIEKLEKLDDEAKDFRDRIGDRNNSYGGGYGDPRYGDPRYGDPRYGDPRYGDPRYGQTRPGGEAFTELLQSYYSARDSLRDLPEEGDVQRDFDRVTGIMRNLTQLYGYRFEPDQEYLEPTIR